jgi:hypothetical protein
VLPENVVQGNVDCIEAFGRLSDDGEVLAERHRERCLLRHRLPLQYLSPYVAPVV